MGDDYFLAWACYVVSALALLLVLWRLLSWMHLKDTRNVIVVMGFAFLFTPVPLEPASSYWAPAFMAALIDFVTVDVEAGLSRLWPMLIAMFVAVLLSFAARLYIHKRKAQNAVAN